MTATSLQLLDAPLPIAIADVNGDSSVDGTDIGLVVHAGFGP
jgi:hypothetical protein